jgi:hypothetical protein
MVRRDRIRLIADNRNRAVREALEAYPETKHILMIDDAYTKYPDQIRKMLAKYDGKYVLGASIWRWERLRIRRLAKFYDTWACPGTQNLRWTLFPPRGTWNMPSVGGCYIFPRSVWEQSGYGVPEPFPDAGNEHSYMLKNSPIPIRLDLSIRFWRTPEDSDVRYYSWPKRVRCSIGEWRRRAPKTLSSLM